MALRSLVLCAIVAVANAVQVVESASKLTFSDSQISFDLLKSNGYIRNITYRGISLLGNVSGQLYTDWPFKAFSLVPNASREVLEGRDWAGIVVTDNNTATGGLIQRSWFLRDGKAGIHSFLRLAYANATPQGPLGESRTMFRPNTPLWTHVVTNREQFATHPSDRAIADEIQVQDATWYIANTPDEPYVREEADYWTKYTFADNQTNRAHGLYGVDAHTDDAYGAWWVVNQKDTFFGGPSHFDLLVDGIAYNKQSTSHGGASSPNITDGFDRTFGPQFVYFNSARGASIQQLLADAERCADPAWDARFYDEIAPHVVGYVSSAQRGALQARVSVPRGAGKVTAVLSANKLHFQDSAADANAYQYWVEDVQDGVVEIGRVKAGTYRLTVYADGIFGDFTKDNVVVNARETTVLDRLAWTAESAGREIWRIGIPDKTSGEFRNGFERDVTRTNQPHKYRIYWGAWDFPTQFPGGVNFTVGTDDWARDWNYVHWAMFGPSYTRNESATDVNRWQIHFALDEAPAAGTVATFTVQLAGATTTAGNSGLPQGAWPNFNISTYVNGGPTALVFPVYYYQSGSCAVRSGISCTLLSEKLTFPATWLVRGANTLVLELPFGAAGIYVQYDALRLELSE